MTLSELYKGWTRRAASPWAKLGDQTGPEPAHGLSLTTHLVDAASVADHLWNEFIPDAVRRHLAQVLGGDAAVRSAVVFCAGVHDIGKLTPPFARKAEAVGRTDIVDGMRRSGLLFPPARDDVPHTLTGQVVLNEWLKRTFGFKRSQANRIAIVVGGHHGTFPSNKQLQDVRGRWWAFSHLELEPDEWAAQECPWHLARNEILDRISAATGFGVEAEHWLESGWPIEAQMLITGIVILTDWIASNEEFFPYCDPDEDRVSNGVAQLDLPVKWAPSRPGAIDAFFAERFPQLGEGGANALQRATYVAANAAKSASLMIVEAPMGSGKTEAAYLAAEALAHRLGCGGIFFGLPTMATANPMFDRTLDWLDNVLDQDASVMLAHSKSSLHDRFAALVREARFKGIYDPNRPWESIERGANEDGAMVASWLLGRKKASQASFVIGTVDQLLLMALQAKHVSLRHLGMAGKVVIVDECHANDDYMRVYLCRALTWLARAGVPVILMSATLPPQQRHEYASAYADGLGAADLAVPAPTGYPTLTLVSHQVTSVPVKADDRQSKIQILPIGDELDSLAAKLTHRLRDGGCAAVIRNTVARAQETFDLLEQRFPGEVVLIHSRFIAAHRRTSERWLVEHLGRGGDRPERLIVVGTQVLEQSLDIDVDLMVTDLAPMDLILQRAGRLHRHARSNRPEPVATPVLLVAGADFTCVPPKPVTGSKLVYGASKLLRAAALIPSVGMIARFPEDIPGLVNAAYDPELPPPSGWGAAWEAADKAQAAKVVAQRDRASSFLLAAPQSRETLIGTDIFDATDPESARSRGKRQVRDAEESLEVVVLVRDADGRLLLPEGVANGELVIPESDLEEMPGSLARRMLASTISLPIAMVKDFDEVETALNRSLDYRNWDTSPWLRGELALVFGPDMTATVGKHHLLYDNRKGLMHTVGRPQ